ncbi:MAG: YndJ family transporter, partial [Candidatus Limnocylindria bacterium]
MSTVRRLVRAIGLQALGGLAVWLIVAAVAANVDSAALDLVSVLLLFAQLVIVPLGLLLMPAPGASPLARALVSSGRFGFRIGGVAALASFALPRGEVAAAVAALYLVPALLVAAASLLRAPLVRRASDLAGVAAGPFLAAGAVLFVLYRQDVAFAGFSELAVQVASVHLHVVGFGLLLMAGALARRTARLG